MMWVHLEYGCVSTCGAACLKTEELNSQVCLILALWSLASSSVVLSLCLNYSTLKYKWEDTLNYSTMQRTRRGKMPTHTFYYICHTDENKIYSPPSFCTIMVLPLFSSSPWRWEKVTGQSHPFRFYGLKENYNSHSSRVTIFIKHCGCN